MPVNAGTRTIEMTNALVGNTIAVCTEWYDDVIQGDTEESLFSRLQAVGPVEHSWDHGATILYDEVWIHPNYRDQPENDDPPGSILRYEFFHVYELDDTRVSRSSRLAPIRVVVGRIGNTRIFDIRSPGSHRA